MPFTNVWDTTQPPDTQPANQLGLDIRNLKLDTMQRMAAISGPLANRPAPETVNADWTGLLYFATDTSQIFRWDNGSATWVDVSVIFGTGVVVKDFGIHAHTGDTTEDTIYSVSIPAGFLGTTGALKIRVAFQTGVTSGLLTLRVRLGGVVVYSVTTGVANMSDILSLILSNRGNPAVQVTTGSFSVSTASPQNATFSTTINTALAQVLSVTVQSNANGDIQTFNQFFVEVF